MLQARFIRNAIAFLNKHQNEIIDWVNENTKTQFTPTGNMFDRLANLSVITDLLNVPPQAGKWYRKSFAMSRESYFWPQPLRLALLFLKILNPGHIKLRPYIGRWKKDDFLNILLYIFSCNSYCFLETHCRSLWDGVPHVRSCS